MKPLHEGNTCPYAFIYGHTNRKLEYYFIVVEQKNMIAVRLIFIIMITTKNSINIHENLTHMYFRCHTITTSQKQWTCYSRFILCSTTNLIRIWRICSIFLNILSMRWRRGTSNHPLAWRIFLIELHNDRFQHVLLEWWQPTFHLFSIISGGSVIFYVYSSIWTKKQKQIN